MHSEVIKLLESTVFVSSITARETASGAVFLFGTIARLSRHAPVVYELPHVSKTYRPRGMDLCYDSCLRDADACWICVFDLFQARAIPDEGRHENLRPF